MSEVDEDKEYYEWAMSKDPAGALGKGPIREVAGRGRRRASKIGTLRVDAALIARLSERAEREGVAPHALAERVLREWLEGGALLGPLEELIRRIKAGGGEEESAA